MREFFVNADFDLSLRRGRDPSRVDARARQAGELQMHLLLLGIGGDTVLVDELPEQAFSTYLERFSLPKPRVCVRPNRTKDAVFTPFGWNDEATRLNRAYDAPAGHPPPAAVRRVNGRRWAAALARELFDDDAVVGVVSSVEELEALLRERPADEGGWIVKSEHGNSGLGNRRILGRRLGEADSKAVERLLAEDECLLVERWRRRKIDLVTAFEVDGEGVVDDVVIYEAVNTAAGAFIGDIFDHRSPRLEKWRPQLFDAAAKVGRELAREGYFGPVCLDAFVWSDTREERLRALVEVNARWQVAAAALRLWRLWDCQPVVYWRLFSSKKLRLPDGYEEIVAALGSDAFDPVSGRGVLLTSPLELAYGRPKRIGVLLAGEDRAVVDLLDRGFRERFEK